MLLTEDKDVYQAYGEGAILWDWLDHPERAAEEVLYEGVTGSGKTRLLCEWVYKVCQRFPVSKGLILRETHISLADSVLPILEEEVLGMTHPAVLNGPSRRGRWQYSHPELGGTIMLGGYDSPIKLFSTQYDWVWFNEVQQTTLEKWELLNRATRRELADGDVEGRLPFNIMIGDCNPDTEFHWANQRWSTESLTNVDGKVRLLGRFWDNPKLYNHETGDWTDAGRRFIQRLQHNLSGVRYQRLFLGKWVAAEGQVWEDWDPTVHIITAHCAPDGRGRWWISSPDFEAREVKFFVGGQDIGFEEPGTLQVWAFDGDDRAYLVAEVYRTHWSHDEWADAWCKIAEDFPPYTILTDHDPAFIENLNKRISGTHKRPMDPIVREWSKKRLKGEEKTGIDQVRVRMREREDGTRGLYVLRDSMRFGKDMRLVEKSKPTCLIEEIPGWVYALQEDGKKYKEEPDPTCPDHGCDCIRGVMAWAQWKDLTAQRPKYEYPKDTLGAILKHDEVEAE